MAVVSGTVSSSPVGPAATVVQAPADECPPNGAGIMGLNGKWVLDPGESFIVQALGVLNTTGNIDWSAAGYFSFTCTASATLTLTFGVTGAPPRPVSRSASSSRSGLFRHLARPAPSPGQTQSHGSAPPRRGPLPMLPLFL